MGHEHEEAARQMEYVHSIFGKKGHHRPKRAPELFIDPKYHLKLVAFGARGELPRRMHQKQHLTRGRVSEESDSTALASNPQSRISLSLSLSLSRALKVERKRLERSLGNSQTNACDQFRTHFLGKLLGQTQLRSVSKTSKTSLVRSLSRALSLSLVRSREILRSQPHVSDDGNSRTNTCVRL